MSTLTQDGLAPVVGLLAIGLVVALVGLGLVWRRAAELGRRLDSLTRGADGQDLEAVLRTHLATVVDVDAEVDRLVGRTAALERDARKAFQRIGLVRFNPFEDTGGNQSFAVVLLDADEDGVVLSSLHARGGTRIYAKAVAGGRPEATLSDEESQALALARGASAGRIALVERAGPGPGAR